MMPFSLVNI